MAVSERFEGANTVDAGRLSPYWGEHAARYLFALRHVTDRTVLDIACGTGYGIALLSHKARFVAGVDIDLAAAREALGECGRNSAVMLADGLRLPFDDGGFEAATSFETLEHLASRAEFLAELRRVLSPDGILLLSTPNALYTRPVDGKPSNPFHVHEYRPDELRDELERSFIVEELLGQRLSSAFGIPPFYDAQRRLPRDVRTQTRLAAWKALNKMPPRVRDAVNQAIWKRPFYPTEHDYVFTPDAISVAPVLFAVCRKRV